MTTKTNGELESANEDFGKHYASMYEGSMVGSGLNVFAVWGYIIAKQRPKKREGTSGDLFVDLNPRLLSVVLGGKEKEINDAITFLCEPDPDSRSDAHDGARLVREGQFNYRVVNGRKYREMYTAERRREQNRQSQQTFRDKQRTRAQVAAESAGRERRFVRADAAGDQAEADRIVGEGT